MANLSLRPVEVRGKAQEPRGVPWFDLVVLAISALLVGALSIFKWLPALSGLTPGVGFLLCSTAAFFWMLWRYHEDG